MLEFAQKRCESIKQFHGGHMYIYVAGAILAYLIGTISPSLIIAKLKKKDLRGGGSGNLGASNTAILLGWQLGVLVGVLDILKAFIPIMVAKYFLSDYEFLPYIVATCVILGHMFPFYLKFKGGKGFATFFGSVLGIHWLAFIIIGLIFLLVVGVSDKMALGTFTVITLFPVYIGIVDKNLIYVGIILIASFVIFLKHIENIRKMINKEEIGIREALAGKHKLKDGE